ncbi:hypothetical protein [Colwellia sp. E2M01]|uniref:hypothetical protein n=1 Tax=Colwellia sp. E2M01 TaxID=2841561 RepID=UPI001C0891DF|nr:hypothetical protein [Colwellia sp. E2M01]MBU2869585.1 hypothetical protein [Colwellia sp. E2M01]
MKNILYGLIIFMPNLVVASDLDLKKIDVKIVNSTNDRLCSNLKDRISNKPQAPLESNIQDGISLITQTSGRYSYNSVDGHKASLKVKWMKGDFFNDGSLITASLRCSMLRGICSDELVIHNKEIDYKNKPEQKFSLSYVRDRPYFQSMYHWPFKVWPGSTVSMMLVRVSPFTFENKTFLLLSDNYDKKDYWAVSLKKSNVVYPSGKYKGKESGSLDITYSCHMKS